MKKMMIALTLMLTMTQLGHAMSYEQARNEALFLTDKMAYELNLTDAQYEAAYEINLDYLMGVSSYDDVYGNYWERRNLDMSYILFDWQWRTFCAASYFYRPLYWRDGYWHFGIYARYPHRDWFYFGRPAFYATYRGAHAWHYVGGRGYYHNRIDHYRPAPPTGGSHFGMLDRWNRGDFRGGRIGHSAPGGVRSSSTRATVNSNRTFGHGRRDGQPRTGGGPSSSQPRHQATPGSSRPGTTQGPTTSRQSSSGSFSRSSSSSPSRGSSVGGATRSSGGSSTGSSHSSSGGGRTMGGRR